MCFYSAYVDPQWTLKSSVAECVDMSAEKALSEPPYAPAVSQRRVAVPYSVLQPFFSQPNLWPTWNVLFGTVDTDASAFKVCADLKAFFHIVPNIYYDGATLQ